jgi:23S rRNA pseudouridine2605 synthase
MSRAWIPSEPTISEPTSSGLPDGIRLQKVLAAAGIGSRRVSEDLIAEGRVTVDGRVAELGARVDPQTAVIHVDGRRVIVRDGMVYLALNKPRGVLSAMSDDRGRRTISDLLGDRTERLFHVGRLDADSEGLLLLTNDGDLAHRLMHPSFGVLKTYLATVPAPVSRDVARRLRAGVVLEDGPVTVDSFRIVQTQGAEAIVEVVLHEGRKHIVRRLLAEVGHPVSRLVRTRIGPVHLGGQRAGSLRELTRDELADLHGVAEAAPTDDDTGDDTGGRAHPEDIE